MDPGLDGMLHVKQESTNFARCYCSTAYSYCIGYTLSLLACYQLYAMGNVPYKKSTLSQKYSEYPHKKPSLSQLEHMQQYFGTVQNNLLKTGNILRFGFPLHKSIGEHRYT